MHSDNDSAPTQTSDTEPKASKGEKKPSGAGNPKGKAPGFKPPAGPKNSGKTSKGRGSAYPIPFNPGKHPIIFDALSGPPKVKEPFLPNPASIATFVAVSFNSWQQGPKWAKSAAFAAQAGIEDLTTRRICVGACLYTASSFLQKHAAIGCADTQFGALKSSDVLVPSSLATALSQFGELQASANGRRYEVPDADSYTSHLIRSAHLYNSPALVQDNQLALIANNWWTPVRPDDPVTDLFLALSLT